MNVFHFWYQRLFQKKRQKQATEFSLGKRPSNDSTQNPQVNKSGQKPTTPIPKSLQQVKDDLSKVLSLPENKDIHLREYTVPDGKKCLLIFIEGLVDSELVNETVLAPLLLGSRMDIPFLAREDIADLQQAITKLLEGAVILFRDGIDQAIVLHAESVPTRSVEAPKTENVVRGPQEGFVEDVVVNKNLIRRVFPSPNLMVEEIYIGKLAPAKNYYLYLRGIANPKLVDEVRTRLLAITTDGALDAGEIEQFIEDRPKSLVPTVLATERPDRAASFLRDGHVVILANRSPNALVLPCTFWSMFHVSEDSFQRAFYGSFIRIIRLISIFITLFAPGVFIAATNYHPGMIPTDLLLAIAGSRERLPFPSIFEVFLMEFSFELIREAGIRIPSALGSTISIVGALILGQAAVQANIISPVIVIVVAITGLASFAIPNSSLGYMIRITRFFLIAFASFFGLIGLTAGFCMILIYVAGIKSAGVPFFSPYVPHAEHNGDLILRNLVFKDKVRPASVRPLRALRVWWSREWDEQ
ncbi:spore germination protein [Fodinisporobacter ferrooxydans]|uniref:Spore germination protein n=1 Tax=Fodinisporobacter ferrooxydans TaxID=2901836 RepID=A0ABY4CK56_9BACL|nr:spore germination protein [Alicyclobacillaceae bacterium MYW30-H2]